MHTFMPQQTEVGIVMINANRHLAAQRSDQFRE
jgi:hypothetical protein